MARPSDSGPGLVRAIGRWDLTAAIVNGVIGSSIFGYPAILARLTGAWSPVAFLLAGLGILTVVLCFAEVASRFRGAGGPYLYAKVAFGPFTGFQAGWLTFWIRVTAIAANLNLLVDYLAQIAPAAGAGSLRLAVMTVAMGAVTLVNLIGVRQATWAVDVFTCVKLLPLALFVAIGLPRLSVSTLASQAVSSPGWTEAILLLVFAYGGFEAPLMAAGEARNPRRDTAFALVAALAVIASFYTLVQLVAVGVVEQLADAKAPLASAFVVLVGPVGVTLAAGAAVLSILGYAAGTTLQSPRVLFAMAEDGELPRALARVHAVWRTPHVAILAYAALALALAGFGSFAWNATLSAVVRLLTYGLTCVALPMLRRRDAEPPGFRLRAAGLFVPVATGFCLWLLATRTIAQAWPLGLLVAVGSVLFFLAPARRASVSSRTRDEAGD
jgi:amino acid transporter